MGFLSPKRQKYPRQITKDTPAFQDEYEFPCSTQNGFNEEGWWQMTWDWSMSHHGWTKQRENSPCFMGKVLEALASENPVQGWWDHVRKSLNLSSNVASSVTEGK